MGEITNVVSHSQFRQKLANNLFQKTRHKGSKFFNSAAITLHKS